MTSVILLAILACLSARLVYGQCPYGASNCDPDQLIQMDLEASDTDPSKSEMTEEKELSPRQLLLGGYGGYGGFGYGGLGYGGYGGYGLGYGGYGGFGGGLSTGLCTRSCFGIGCRLICRNRVFFDEDPEESQDSTDSQDSSDDELSEDEMNDLSMQDESDDTDAQDDHMGGSTRGDWNPDRKHAASCGNPSHGHSNTKGDRIDILDSSRVVPESLIWSKGNPREITDSRIPGVKELMKSGKRVFVVSHNVFKTLHPNDLIIRKKYVVNPDGSKTWTRFQTVTRTSHTGMPSVINNEKNNESTISNNSGSLENNSSLEKNRTVKEESSRGTFNRGPETVDRLETVERLGSEDRNPNEVPRHGGKMKKILEMLRRQKEEERLEREMRMWRRTHPREGALETSNVEGSRLPPMENAGVNTLTEKEILKMLMKMKMKKHKRRPIVIVMDEDQLAQQDQEQQEDQEQQPEM